MTRWEGEHCWAWGENLLLRHLSVFAASQLPVPGDILAKTKAFTIFALCVTISLIHIDFVSSASSKRFRCNFVLLYIEYVTNSLLFPKVTLHSLFYLGHLDCQNAPYNKFLSPCLLFLCIPIRPYIPNCQKKSSAQTLLAAVSTQSPLPYHILNLPFSINKFFRFGCIHILPSQN